MNNKPISIDSFDGDILKPDWTEVVVLTVVDEGDLLTSETLFDCL